MKKAILLIVTFCFLLTNGANSQKSLMFGAGVSGSFLGQRATRDIIDRYNETRPWLDKKMGYTNPFGGFAFSIGRDVGTYSFTFAVNLQKSTVKASGTDASGQLIERELRVKSSFWSFNGLWDFGSMWDLNYGLGINLGGAFGGGDYYTRVTGESEFRKITNTGYDGSGIFFGIFYENYFLGDEESGLSFRVTPYMRGAPGTILNITDMTPLLKELDPANAGTPIENKLNNHMALGIDIQLILRIQR